MLLGMDSGDGTIEITQTIPSLRPSDLSEEEINHDEFRSEYLRNIQEVNVDRFCMGWYAPVVSGLFCTQSLLDGQFSLQTQESTPNSVMLLYDPSSLELGELCFKVIDNCKLSAFYYPFTGLPALRRLHLTHQALIKILPRPLLLPQGTSHQDHQLIPCVCSSLLLDIFLCIEKWGVV